MLQITTGKLFTQTACKAKSLRDHLFTNLRLGGMPLKVLEGALSGRLVQASEPSALPNMLVYECTGIEAIESGLRVLA